MCFSLQRRAIFSTSFPHRNFKKWSGNGVVCTFWLAHVLLATAACEFCASKLPKVVRTCCVLYILTCTCASRYSGVQVFYSSSKQVPPHPPLYRAYFSTQPTQIIEKSQRFATSPTFRACVSSCYWLSRNCIFFLLTLLLFSAFHLLTLLLCSAFSAVHIVGS